MESSYLVTIQVLNATTPTLYHQQFTAFRSGRVHMVLNSSQVQTFFMHLGTNFTKKQKKGKKEKKTCVDSSKGIPFLRLSHYGTRCGQENLKAYLCFTRKEVSELRLFLTVERTANTDKFPYSS